MEEEQEIASTPAGGDLEHAGAIAFEGKLIKGSDTGERACVHVFFLCV